MRLPFIDSALLYIGALYGRYDCNLNLSLPTSDLCDHTSMFPDRFNCNRNILTCNPAQRTIYYKLQSYLPKRGPLYNKSLSIKDTSI